MQKELAQEWAEALLSGEYKQGKNALTSNIGSFTTPKRGYCCWGVLTEIAKPENWDDDLTNLTLPQSCFDENFIVSVDPSFYGDHKIEDPDVYVPKSPIDQTFSRLNDSGAYPVGDGRRKFRSRLSEDSKSTPWNFEEIGTLILFGIETGEYKNW